MADDVGTENQDFDVSVIVIAYIRTQFIMKAIDSIRTKENSKFKIEIIVVKNFIEPTIDRELNAKASKVVTTDKKTLGAKMALGIEFSHSEILMFLEDDDVFLDGKISSILAFFEKETVGYVHNGYSLIDEDGKYLRKHVRKKYKVHWLNGNEPRDIFKILNLKGNFNLSCMSVRKKLIIRYIEDLRNFQVASDNLLFYISLDSEYSMIFTERELSGYRVHSSNHSISHCYTLGDFVKNKVSFLGEDIIALRRIDKMLQSDVIRSILQDRILIPEMMLASLNPTSRSSLCVMSILPLIHRSVKMRNVIFFPVYITFMSSRIIPGSGKVIYYILEKIVINLNRI